MSEWSISNPLPLRALIIEDECPARNYLAELLQASGLAEVVGAAAGLNAARELLQVDRTLRRSMSSSWMCAWSESGRLDGFGLLRDADWTAWPASKTP